MALGATVFHWQVSVSDVDRGFYDEVGLRIARHPSENMRYLLTRAIAYCLEYEEGIAFSKGGLSDDEDPPISVRDLTGLLLAWIDIGSPSADRLHRAAKAAPRVALYTSAELALLRREASSRTIHRGADIAVWRLEPAMLDALEKKVDRTGKIDLLRNDGQLYVTVGGATVEGTITRASLVDP